MLAAMMMMMETDEEPQVMANDTPNTATAMSVSTSFVAPPSPSPSPSPPPQPIDEEGVHHHHSNDGADAMQSQMGSVWQAQMGGAAVGAAGNTRKGAAVLARIAGTSRPHKAPVLKALRANKANSLTVNLVKDALKTTPSAAAATASASATTVAMTTPQSPIVDNSAPLTNMMTLHDFAQRQHINAVAAVAASIKKAEATAAATMANAPSTTKQTTTTKLPSSSSPPPPPLPSVASMLNAEKERIVAAEAAAVVPSSLPAPGQALNTSSIQMPASLSVYTQRDAQLFQMVMQSVSHVKSVKHLNVEQPPVISAEWMGFLLRRATSPFRECTSQAACFMARMDGGANGLFPCVQFHTPAQYDFVVRTGQLPARMSGLCVLCLATFYVQASAHLTAQSAATSSAVAGDMRLNIPFYNKVNCPGEYVKDACLTQTLGQLNGVQLSIRTPTMSDFVPCMVNVLVPLRDPRDNAIMRNADGSMRFQTVQVPGFRERDELRFRDGQSPVPVTRPVAPLATPRTEHHGTAFEYALRARMINAKEGVKTLHDVLAQDHDPATAPAFRPEIKFYARIADMAFRPLLSAVRLVRYMSVAEQWGEAEWYKFMNTHHLLILPPTEATGSAATGTGTASSSQMGGGSDQNGEPPQPSFVAMLYAAVMGALSAGNPSVAQALAEAPGALAPMPDVREHLLFYMTYSRLEVTELIKTALVEREIDSAYRPPTGAKSRGTVGKAAGIENFIAQLRQFHVAYIPILDWFIKRLQVGATIDDTTLLERCPADEQMTLDDVRNMQIANLILQSDHDEHTSWFHLLEPHYQAHVRPGDFMFVQCRTTIEWQPSSAERVAAHYYTTSTSSSSAHALRPRPSVATDPTTTAAAIAATASRSALVLDALETRIVGSLLSPYEEPNNNSNNSVTFLRSVLNDLVNATAPLDMPVYATESVTRRSMLDELNKRTFSGNLLDKVALFREHPDWAPRHSLWMPDRVAVHVPAVGAAKDAETLELVRQCTEWNTRVAHALLAPRSRGDYAVLAALTDTLNHAMHCRNVESARLAKLVALYNQEQQQHQSMPKQKSTAATHTISRRANNANMAPTTTTTTSSSSSGMLHTAAAITTNKALERLFNVVGEYTSNASFSEPSSPRRATSSGGGGGGGSTTARGGGGSSSGMADGADVDDNDNESDTSSVAASATTTTTTTATPTTLNGAMVDEDKRNAIELQHFLDQCEMDDSMALPDSELEQRHERYVNDYTLLGPKSLRSAVVMAQSEAAQRFYNELDERRRGFEQFQATANLETATPPMAITEAALACHCPVEGPFALDAPTVAATTANGDGTSHHHHQSQRHSHGHAPKRLNMPPPPHVANVRFDDQSTTPAQTLPPLKPAAVPLQALFCQNGAASPSSEQQQQQQQRSHGLVEQIIHDAQAQARKETPRALVLRLCVDYWTGVVHALTTFVQSHMRITLAALQAEDPNDAHFFATPTSLKQGVLSRFDTTLPNDTFSASERFLPDMTHHVLDMRQFIGTKSAAASATSDGAAAAAAAAAAASSDDSTASGNAKGKGKAKGRAKGQSKAKAKAATAPRKRPQADNNNNTGTDASSSNGDDDSTAANTGDKVTPLVYQAWMQVLQRAMPRVCHVHIATRDIVDFANASTEFLLCVLRLLRVSLMGGYRYEHQMVDFNTCLVLERMFIECEQAALCEGENSTAAVRVLAPFRTFLACNGLVVLYAVREYLVRMIELSPAVDGFIRSHYRDYDMFVRYVRVCVGAMRVALSHNRSLQGINEQTAKALANKTSQKIWTSYRAENSSTFVSRMCGVFKRVDQAKVAVQIRFNPHAEQYHVEKLPAFVAEAIYAYVCTLEPGESFKAHWLRDLGFREHTIELVHRLAACFTQLNDKAILAYLLALPGDEYSMLALFFHLLLYHGMRRLVPLEPCLTAAQMTALRQHYHVPCDELVPEHLTTTYCCSALACYELLTAINSGLRSTTRVAKQPGVRQDYETHTLTCTNKRMRRDHDGILKQKQASNSKKYEVWRATYEQLLKRPHNERDRRAEEVARIDFYAVCMKNARLLVRSQYEYPCNETPAVPVPSVGHVLQWSKVKETPTHMLCTLCPRCASYGVFSTMLIDANGYSCGICDTQERALLREPCCVVCAKPVSATRERASVKQHNATTRVRRLFSGFGYRASHKYEAKAVATGASMRYRAADDIEPHHVLLVDDTSDWQLRPFMVCAPCWMVWMPAATLQLTRSEFVFCALNRVDGPHEAYLGQKMEM